MIDTMNSERLVVSKDPGAGPYIMLAVAQLDAVRAVLDAEKIPYWVDREALSLDGKPYVTVINFSRKIDAMEIQRLLDALP
jgi:hypothetical protein